MPGWIRLFVKLVTAVWCRSVETVGVQNVPRGVPILVVANHENGLIDPLLIASRLPVGPRFLAKNTLWKNPVLRFLFWLGRVVPVHRKQDAGEGADMKKNAETFEIAAAVLASGGVLAIFPEGQSHNEPQLQPLKTGAARIALEAPPATRILPVGILFHDKHRFRSKALLTIGEAVDPAAARERAKTDPRGAAHMLTDSIADALRRVTVNVPTWEERRLLERAVEIARADEHASLEAKARHLRAFYEAYRHFSVKRPDAIESLRRDVGRYDRTLRVLGLSDEEVRARYGPGSVVRWGSRFIRMVVLRLPFGVLGAVLHAIPYRLPRWIATRKTPQDLDQPASWKLFSAIVIFPVWWLLLAGLAWWGWGRIEMAGWALVVAPISGFIALLWLESGVTLFEQAKAFLLWPARRRLLEEVRERRETIRRELASLEAEWRATPESDVVRA